MDDTHGTSCWNGDAWSEELKNAVRDVGTLLEELKLAPESAGVDFAPDFPVLVPRSFLARMCPGDPNDPLLRQVLPLSAERLEVEGYSVDPLRERGATTRPTLIQKYAERVLLVASTACAIHCRYCFRRHFPYAMHRPRHLDAALEAICADPSIREVILSGGDPLVLPDPVLHGLLRDLDSIPHIQRLRIHTRLPVVIPHRVTDALLEAMSSVRNTLVLVFHFNHPNELDEDTRTALDRSHRAVTQMLNQSVFLRGVNDCPTTLTRLSERLLECRVLPYYLHLPDRVAGTAHFNVEFQRASLIHSAMRAQVSGYLVPRLVRETPGMPSKELVSE